MNVENRQSRAYGCLALARKKGEERKRKKEDRLRDGQKEGLHMTLSFTLYVQRELWAGWTLFLRHSLLAQHFMRGMGKMNAQVMG